MKLDVIKLDGGKGGSIELSDDIFGIEPRRHPAALRHLAARQAPRRHPQDPGPQRGLSHRQEDVQAEGHRRRPSRLAPRGPVRRRRQAHGPVVRSHAFDLPKKVRALALRHALSSKAKDGALIVLDNATLTDPKTAALRSSFGKLGLSNALVIAGAEVERQLRAGRAQHPERRCAAERRAQRLRRPAAPDARPDQGGGRRAGGALQMSSRSASLRHHPVPGDHREGHAALGAEQGRLPGRADATKDEIAAAVEELFKVKVTKVNTLDPQGQDQALPRHARPASRRQESRS